MTTITLPRHDVTKFCRFCLSEINLLNVIGSSPAEQQAHGELLRLVTNYLRIEFQPEKDFPSAICEMCIALLHDFDTLYKNAHDYNYALRLLSGCPSMTDIETEIPVNEIEPGLVNTCEPSSLIFIDSDNNAYGEELLVTNALDGQIVLEDVPVSETAEQEAQIDVYHVDGQLQHIVMEGGTRIEVETEETPKPAPPPISGNLLNASLAKSGTHLSIRKRTAPPHTSASPQLPKKPLPMKPSSIPVNNTPTRTLNVEANTKRYPQQAGHKQHVAAAGWKQLYRCNHCANLFVELSNLYSHNCPKRQKEPILNSAVKPTVVSSEGQRIKCKLCNMSYRTKLQYQKHEYEVHGIRNENFGIQCNICQKLFSQRQDYQLHVRAIHPTQGMSFVKIHSQ